MCLLVRRCLTRSHLVQELYESWQLDHKEAMLAGDAEQLCGEWLELANLCKRVWDGLLRALFDGSVWDTEKVGEVFRDSIKRSLNVGRKIHTLALEAVRREYEIEAGEELASKVTEMEALEKELPVKWPFVDKDRMVEARAAYGRGEYQPIEDILNATQGRGSETH